MPRTTKLAALAVVVLVASAPAPPARSPERIEANDNLRPAGTLRGGVLRLQLEARPGMWHPNGEDAPGAEVLAFAERGGAPRVPGPLVRVPAGTEVVASVTNAVPGRTLTVFGLIPRPASGGGFGDSLRLAPGETREARFRLDAPGTYYYWATTGRPFFQRTRDDAQLSGAIVVDAPGAAASDRVLVIGEWADTAGSEDVPERERGRLLFVVNGRTWPRTARLSYQVGDTVRWRVVNTSADIHPMHLHGFYFRVDARGDWSADTTYGAAERELAVTDRLTPGRTMRLTWVPERPGNWLFHCHTPMHFMPRGPLGMPLDPSGVAGHADHAREGMSGLVVGVHVAPRPEAARDDSASAAAVRRIRLLLRPVPGDTGANPLYSVALHEGGDEPPVRAVPRAGPPLVLVRGEPVAITVVNRTASPTAIHWHGIELESYFDGVPGFSGSGTRLAPLVAPADSFEVSFTPPRAGTFMYHSHADEIRQQLGGLAGAIVVVEPGEPLDPAMDTPVLVTTPNDSASARRAVLINGEMEPAPLVLRAGLPHRLRLANITVARPGLRIELRRDTTLLAWRIVAKDGAAVPASRRAMRPARQPLSIGETMDVEYVPAAGSQARLEMRTTRGVLLGVLPIRAGPLVGAP